MWPIQAHQFAINRRNRAYIHTFEWVGARVFLFNASRLCAMTVNGINALRSWRGAAFCRKHRNEVRNCGKIKKISITRDANIFSFNYWCWNLIQLNMNASRMHSSYFITTFHLNTSRPIFISPHRYLLYRTSDGTSCLWKISMPFDVVLFIYFGILYWHYKHNIQYASNLLSKLFHRSALIQPHSHCAIEALRRNWYLNFAQVTLQKCIRSNN